MGLHRQLHTYMGLHRQLRGASSETTGSPPCGLSVPVSPSACHVTSPRLQLLLTHTYTLCGLYVFMCSKKWLSQTLTSLTLTSRSGAVVELETWTRPGLHSADTTNYVQPRTQMKFGGRPFHTLAEQSGTCYQMNFIERQRWTVSNASSRPIFSPRATFSWFYLFFNTFWHL